jgi:hypothetical protein
MFSAAWKMLKETVFAFINDEALSRGAAIAFYTVTSIAPVAAKPIAVGYPGYPIVSREGRTRSSLDLSPASIDLAGTSRASAISPPCWWRSNLSCCTKWFQTPP